MVGDNPPVPDEHAGQSDDFESADDENNEPAPARAADAAARMALNFEDVNTDDPADILGKLHQIVLPYDSANLKKWIRRLEIKMETYGVTSQWSKRVVIENNLPMVVQDDLNDLLEKGKAEAGATIYKEKIKTKLLKKHSPKEDADFRKAQKLVMTDKPSTTAILLRDLVCKQKTKFTNCCCGVQVEAMWVDTLPTQVQSHIANLSLKDDFEGTTDAADRVYATLKTAAAPIAAVNTVTATAQPASGTAEVAAFKPTRGNGNPRNPRGGVSPIGPEAGDGGQVDPGHPLQTQKIPALGVTHMKTAHHPGRA